MTLIAVAIILPHTGEERPILLNLTPDHEHTIAAWCTEANPRVSGATFVNALAEQHLQVSRGKALVETFDRLSCTDRALAVELVSVGAFSRSELTNPERILAYFARPDWTEIVTAWRKSRTRQIRHIVRRFDTPTPEAQPRTEPAPGVRPTLVSPATREVCSLQQCVEVALPRRVRKQRANCLALLRVLAREPMVLWSVERMKTAVEQERRDCNAKFPLDKLRECLTALVAADLVSQSGVTYRHKPRLE